MQSLFSIKLKRKAKKYFSQGLLVKEKENQMQNFKTAVFVFRTQKVIFGDKSLGDHSSTVMRISLRALLTKTTFTEASLIGVKRYPTQFLSYLARMS